MSNTFRLLAAFTLAITACASDDDSTDTGDPNVPESAGDTEASTQVQFVSAPADVDRATCQANGPCSPACDDALILELFVPAGTCVVYDCGDTRVGGCN